MKKKNLIKGLALVCGMGLCLAGCGAPLSDITDKNGNNLSYSEPVYYQGQVARVGDYLFYGNAYADISADDFNYDSEKELAYMSRLNLTDIAFGEDVADDNYKHSSPNGIEKVNGDKLVGYKNQEMFVFGEYVYFTSANIHKTSSMKNDYSRVSLFRIKFNGDGLEEIGTYTHDDKSTITLQKGSDGNYYFVIVCPAEKATEEEATTYDVYSVQVGSSVGKEKKIVSKALSVVVADQDASAKTVVYTFDPESDRMNCAVKAVDFANETETTLDPGLEETITLIDRVGDVALYSYENEVYYKNVSTNGTLVPSIDQLFFSAPTIGEVEKVGQGYVFKGTSALVYKESLSAQAERLATSTEYTDMLFADGDYVYLSNASTIIRKSVNEKETETLVSEMTIISGQCGYDGDYIYFYAQRGKLEGEESEETDTNYYLYQADKNGNIQLLSQV